VLFFWLFLPSLSRGQVNLVSNGDFEDTTNCNNLYSYLSSAPWFNPNVATPDYFGPTFQCGANPYEQTPLSGDAYFGMYFHQSPSTREYVEVLLNNQLVFNHIYEVKYLVSRSDHFKRAQNRFEACFTDTILAHTNQPDTRLTCNSIQLNSSNQIITNTLNWIELSGYYIANGTEKYLTIGNFSHDSLITVVIVNNSAPSNGAYYYVDDVSVI
jgi:hypothetical protein